MAQNEISVATTQRLPIYLDYLKTLTGETAYISATTIAMALGFGEVQVRKDLASVSSSGKPKIGYHIGELIEKLEVALGYDTVMSAVLVGAGKLGSALLGYEGFSRSGLKILAAFEKDPEKIGKTESGKPILSMDDLSAFCEQNNVQIGIVTVPAVHAASASEALIRAGIRAIWNFAPAHLEVPEHIIVKNENMASSLAVLSRSLAKKLDEEQ